MQLVDRIDHIRLVEPDVRVQTLPLWNSGLGVLLPSLMYVE
jgi:hypothetical protein